MVKKLMTVNKLKSFFNQKVVEDIATNISKNYPGFRAGEFITEIMRDLPNLELKGRGLRISQGMKVHLPENFSEAIEILITSMGKDNGSGGMEGMNGFRYLPYLNYVGLYGLEYPEISLKTLRHMTLYFSGEFDIRHFIVEHYEVSMDEIRKWVKDKDWRVRRLVSEGTRPNLPWGIKLNVFVKNPAPIIELLNQLYLDSHKSVRKSVANSLNDISKNNPQIAIETARNWITASPDSLPLVKHGLRTLIKQGNQEALALLGFKANKIYLEDFSINRQIIKIGDTLTFSASLTSEESHPVAVVIDYAIHHMRKNGKTTAKVFKLTQKEFTPGQNITISKTHSFKVISTRKYYNGEHKLEIFANGVSVGIKGFTLNA